MNSITKILSVHLVSAQPDAKEVVDALAELCHRNVKSIRTCAECFQYWAEDPQNYFTKVCTKPHLLVYAKALGNFFLGFSANFCRC